MGVMMVQRYSYLELKEKVWDTGICSGCGACVAVCPADALFFPEQPGIFHPSSTGYCKMVTDSVPCGACFEACPRTESPRQDSETCTNPRRILRAQARDPSPYRQSGGAVTAILTAGMMAGFIDGVVTVSEDRWTHQARSVLITRSGDLAMHAGSRYNWSVPVLRSLKEAVIDHKLTSIAVVGTPCVVQAARAMKNSSHDLLIPFGRSIRLILGLFCTESFDYHTLMDEIIRGGTGISSFQVKGMDVKGKLDLLLDDGTTRSLSLEEVGGAVREGCHTCSDFSAPDADISAGSVGTPDGYTTILVRTAEGEGFVTEAERQGLLTVSEDVDMTSVYRLASAKRARSGRS